MPQVAQQDYIRIAPKIGRTIYNDAAGLARIKQLLQRGTILDAQIITAFEDNTEDSGEIGRVVGFFKDQTAYVYDGYNGEILNIITPDSEKQYEGLAAVQLSIDEYGGNVFEDLPKIRIGDIRELFEFIKMVKIGVNGHYLIATQSGGKLATISLGEQIPEGTEFINITWEDAQKLIGLPIN